MFTIIGADQLGPKYGDGDSEQLRLSRTKNTVGGSAARLRKINASTVVTWVAPRPVYGAWRDNFCYLHRVLAADAGENTQHVERFPG